MTRRREAFKSYLEEVGLAGFGVYELPHISRGFGKDFIVGLEDCFASRLEVRVLGEDRDLGIPSIRSQGMDWFWQARFYRDRSGNGLLVRGGFERVLRLGHRSARCRLSYTPFARIMGWTCDCNLVAVVYVQGGMVGDAAKEHPFRDAIGWEVCEVYHVEVMVFGVPGHLEEVCF